MKNKTNDHGYVRNPVLALCMTYHKVCSKSKTTSNGIGTDYYSGSPDISQDALQIIICVLNLFVLSELLLSVTSGYAMHLTYQ